MQAPDNIDGKAVLEETQMKRLQRMFFGGRRWAKKPGPPISRKKQRALKAKRRKKRKQVKKSRREQR